jgi:hypothetical protein
MSGADHWEIYEVFKTFKTLGVNANYHKEGHLQIFPKDE